MITEDYVSFETTKLLKEKGFDVSEIDAYFPFVYYANGKMDFYDDDYPLFVCEAVTLQMAMKWLREVHNKSIEIRSQGLKATSIGWIVEIYNLVNQDEEFHHPYTFPTYEEAAEAAIKYCLENLI